MDLFDIAVAKKLAGGGGGGGGGSSDLSMATITIEGAVNITGAQIVYSSEHGTPFDFLSSVEYEVFKDTTIDTALYKGRGVIGAYPAVIHSSITVSGNIEEIDTGIYVITGNCTITGS